MNILDLSFIDLIDVSAGYNYFYTVVVLAIGSFLIQVKLYPNSSEILILDKTLYLSRRRDLSTAKYAFSVRKEFSRIAELL